MTHAPAGSLIGNRITSNRWAKMFRGLGHRVAINQSLDKCDALIAIHAERSAKKLLSFHRKYPERPAILLLAGTDVYAPEGFSSRARDAVEQACGLVALEVNSKQRLKTKWRKKTVVINQSANSPNRTFVPLKSSFEISLCGHLRKVKQPFFAVEAAIDLPTDSRVRINHYGDALSAEMKKVAQRWMKKSRRYRWAGSKPHWRTRQLVARSQLLINTSLIESCANSIIEAIVSGTPVLATNIPGNTGVLGVDYPGLFSPTQPRTLTKLIMRVENEPGFLNELKKRCASIAQQHTPIIEQACWRKYLRQVM